MPSLSDPPVREEVLRTRSPIGEKTCGEKWVTNTIFTAVNIHCQSLGSVQIFVFPTHPVALFRRPFDPIPSGERKTNFSFNVNDVPFSIIQNTVPYSSLFHLPADLYIFFPSPLSYRILFHAGLKDGVARATN